MKMRSPVDLDVANFEKAAPSLQAVQRQMVRFGISLRAHPGPSHRLDVHRPVSLDGLGPHVGRQANKPFTSAFALFLAQQFGLRLQGFFVHQSLPPAQEGRLSEPMLRAIATLRQAAALPCLDVNRPPFTSAFVLEVFRSHRRFSNAAENLKWYENALLKSCAETGRLRLLRVDQGRQDKSAASGRAHVVGWIEDFGHPAYPTCWRFRLKRERFQLPERHLGDRERRSPASQRGTMTSIRAPAASITATRAPSDRRASLER